MVSIPDDVVRINIVWATDNGQEIAVNTLHSKLHHFTGNTVDWDAVTQQIASGVATRLTGHWNDLQQGISNSGKITRVDAYHLDNAGHTLNKGTQGTGNPGLVGTAGSMMPPHLAAVVQLWGFTPGGFSHGARSHRGRLFLPSLAGVVVDGEGLLSSSAANQFSFAWAGLLNDVQGMNVGGSTGANSSDYVDVGILSRKLGVFSNITAVTCSRTFAVQRRRINKLVRQRTNPTAVVHG